MGLWYEKFPAYYEKFEKTSKDIKDGSYHPDLPGTLSMKDISVSGDSFVYHGQEKLKHFLSKLQYFAHFNTSSTDVRNSHTIECNILGQCITFRLSESQIRSKYKETGKQMVRGRQILFDVEENGSRKRIAYADIMPQLEAYPSKELGRAMLNSLNRSRLRQNSQGLKKEIIRAASLFILLTHIPEAAVPFEETMKEFDSAIRYNQLPFSDKIVNIKKKTGRIPMADKIVRSKLRAVAEGKVLFKDTFSEEKFVIRSKDGTSKGRIWMLTAFNGKEVLTGDLSDSDDESDCSFLPGSQIKSKYREYPYQYLLPES